MPMRPHRSPEGDHTVHMDHRRVTAPYLFNRTGSYKNWLHFFSIQRDRSGASINMNTHLVLPWELESTTLDATTFDILHAHFNVHRMVEWHPHWRSQWRHIAKDLYQRRDEAADSGFWLLLHDPGIQVLAQWLVNLKRTQRILMQDGLDREGVELLCRPHLIFNPSSPLGD